MPKDVIEMKLTTLLFQGFVFAARKIIPVARAMIKTEPRWKISETALFSCPDKKPILLNPKLIIAVPIISKDKELNTSINPDFAEQYLESLFCR